MHPTEKENTPPSASLSYRFEAAQPRKQPVRRGSPCPQCGQGILDYNGVLDLECPSCGYTEGGGGGCT